MSCGTPGFVWLYRLSCLCGSSFLQFENVFGSLRLPSHAVDNVVTGHRVFALRLRRASGETELVAKPRILLYQLCSAGQSTRRWYDQELELALTIPWGHTGNPTFYLRNERHMETSAQSQS